MPQNKAIAQANNITLQPEQEKVLKLPAKGTVLIKGVAGSGKTTIAMYRAKYLSDTYKDLFRPNNIAIFTFNRLLANCLGQIKDSIRVSYGEANTTATPDELYSFHPYIVNFHQWAYKFLKNYSNSHVETTISGYACHDLIQDILRKHNDWSIKTKCIDFLVEEIGWIKGKLLLSLDEYQNITRSGRGTSIRLSQSERKEIWMLLAEYNEALKQAGKIDFNDYALLCLHYIDSDPNFKPPYTHIVIDEAQDLNKAQLSVIKRLVSPTTNSITIIADAAQRIYKSGFTWPEVGFDFKGKTCILKRNYRSTIEIAKAALSLLNNDPQSKEFTQIETARRGKYIPIIYKGRTSAEQWSYISLLIFDFLKKYKNVAVLSNTAKSLDDLESQCASAGLSPYTLSKSRELPSDKKGLYLCTLSSAKGLEFDVVFIVNCNAVKSTFNSVATHDEEHISTERRKLFTAMTRAREELYLVSSDIDYSPFLDEIAPDSVDIIEP